MLLKPSNRRRRGLRSYTLALALALAVALLSATPGFASELDDANQDWAAGNVNSAVVRLNGNTNAVFARAAIEHRESGEAAFITQIRSGLEAFPNNLQLRIALVQQLLAQKATDEALQLLTQTPAAQADEPALIMLRAQAELAAGHPAVIDVNARYAVQRREFDRAIEDLSRLHRDYPKQQLYMMDLSEALSAAGRKRQAMAVVNHWISDHPQATRPRLLLAQMQLEAGDNAAATQTRSFPEKAEAEALFLQLAKDR